MNHFMYKAFIFLCCGFLLAGCIFSWKPNISDSNVSVNDNTSVEVPYEEKK